MYLGRYSGKYFGYWYGTITEDAGGVKGRGQANYLTEAEKKRIEELLALLEAELNKLSEPKPKQEIKKTERKIATYKAELIKLDPHLGASIESLAELVKNNRQRSKEIEVQKATRRTRNRKALLFLLNL